MGCYHLLLGSPLGTEARLLGQSGFAKPRHMTSTVKSAANNLLHTQGCEKLLNRGVDRTIVQNCHVHPRHDPAIFEPDRSLQGLDSETSLHPVWL